MNYDANEFLRDIMAKAVEAKARHDAYTDKCTECAERIAKPGLCFSCEDAKRERLNVIRSTVITIPARYRWAKFTAPELPTRVKNAAAIARAQKAIGEDRVVLTGPAGAGKTVLATCILQETAAAGTVGVFVNAFTLAVARSQLGLGKGEALDVDHALDARLLLLDDLGNESNAPQSAVPDVLFARHEAMKPTVITTWMGPDALAAKYGDGIARRVFEGAFVIDLGRGGR